MARPFLFGLRNYTGYLYGKETYFFLKKVYEIVKNIPTSLPHMYRPLPIFQKTSSSFSKMCDDLRRNGERYFFW